MTESHTEARDSARLVVAARAGDERALSTLVADHLPLVYNLIGRALNGHADVDDLVQETMVRMVRGLPRLQDPDCFRSWLVTIAYRQVQTHLRRRMKPVLHWQAKHDDVPDPAGDFAERTVSELMLTGQRRELAEATRWLDEDDRRLLALWWQEATGELTRAELADALGVSPRHAAVRVQRMRAQLESARTVIRALQASPRCPELAGILRTWHGSTDALWRKRIARHARACPHCGAGTNELVAPEQLLLGMPGLAMPVAVVAAARVALETQAVTPIALSVGHGVLTGVHNVLTNKTAATAATVAVLAGGGFVFAVQYETTPSVRDGIAIVDPTDPPPVGAPVVTSGAPAAPTPTGGASRRPIATGNGVAAADLYVSPGGSDDADGSAARPFATLNRAVAVVRPGQTIALRGGTYRLSSPITINTNGTAAQRITISSYRDERPVLDATAIPADKWAVTQRASYWTAQGLEVRNSRSHAWVCLSCRYNVFQRMSFHDNVRSGLTLRDPGTVGNQVLDSDFFANRDPSAPGRAGVGLAIKFGDGTGNLVRGNRAFHNADNGFDLGYFASPVALEYNWSFGNGHNRWNLADWDSDGDGFALGGGNVAAAHQVRHNIAWDNIHDGFSDNGNPAPMVLSNNTAYRNAGGFMLVAGSSTARSNVAVENGTDVRAASGVRSSRNTWDGGSWTTSLFRSTDSGTAEGARRADGRLPRTAYLSTGNGMGASLQP